MFGRGWLIAVGAARAAKYYAAHANFSCAVEQRDGAGNTCRVRIERRIDAPRNRGQRGFVKDYFDAFERPGDNAWINKIALDKFNALAKSQARRT